MLGESTINIYSFSYFIMKYLLTTLLSLFILSSCGNTSSDVKINTVWDQMKNKQFSVADQSQQWDKNPYNLQ